MMEGLVDPGGFLKMLEKAAEEASQELGMTLGIKSKQDKGSETARTEELENIYVKSLIRILKITDKLAAGQFTDDSQLKLKAETTLPKEDQERKCFRIGDRVVIGCSYHYFKYVQKKMSAWKKTMRNLHGQHGIVTDQNDTRDRSVQVYFPSIFSSCAISTAVLEKDTCLPKEHVIRSQWEVGNYVQTCSHKVVVKKLMLRLPDIPEKFIGKPGKVIAVTTAGVFVTFDGLRSFAIESALLQKSDQEPNIEIVEKSHRREFKTGDKVKVISQLRKLISNQIGKGGWNKDMCSMAGKQGFITNINDDGTVDVSCEFSRGYRMNPDSILKPYELEPEEAVEELDFNPGDKVRVKMTEDIRTNLIAKNIPLVFLEYLLLTGEVNAIDDNLDAWTRFNSTARICMKMSSLVKVTEKEAQKFDKVKKDLASLKVGDKVYLDVGPPNYVRKVLAQYGTDDAIVKAMATTSEVVEWVDAQHAVIRYPDGRRFRLNKKYLTTPERFDIQESEGDEFVWKSVEEMESAITDCVKRIHEEDISERLKNDFSVEVYSMLRGQPPTVEFRIRSTLATADSICEYLEQIHEWEIEKIYAETYRVARLRTSSQEVKMGLLFNEDIYLSSVRSGSHEQPSVALQRAVENAKVAKKKDIDEEMADQRVESLDELRLFKLQDASLSRAIYFPYVVRGPSHEIDEGQRQSTRDNKGTHININSGNVNIHNPKVGLMQIN